MSCDLSTWIVWERGNKGYKKRIIADRSRSAAKQFIYRDKAGVDEKKGFVLDVGEEMIVCTENINGVVEEFELSVFDCKLYNRRRICALPVVSSSQFSTVKP